MKCCSYKKISECVIRRGYSYCEVCLEKNKYWEKIFGCILLGIFLIGLVEVICLTSNQKHFV